jgi:ADP-ribosylglycohydrolase
MRRASGSLFGLAYGDALGRPTEFLGFAEITRRYGPRGPSRLDGDPALVTDDTQMTLAVAWALHDATAVKPDDTPDPMRLTPQLLEPLLRQRFAAWVRDTDDGRAPGMTCLRACTALAEGVPWQRASVVEAKGCGANMRVTPVGLVPGIDNDTLAGVAQLQAALTHGHPTALVAAELTAYCVKLLVRDGVALVDLPGLLRERCRDQRRRYRSDWLGELWRRADAPDGPDFIARGWDECQAAIDRVDAVLLLADRDADPCLGTGAGWVAEEALATALHCALLFPDDPVSALGRAAGTSGDSDSIACLTGALVGAARGLAGWPDRWARQIEYADQLAALGACWD